MSAAVEIREDLVLSPELVDELQPPCGVRSFRHPGPCPDAATWALRLEHSCTHVDVVLACDAHKVEASSPEVAWECSVCQVFAVLRSLSAERL